MRDTAHPNSSGPQRDRQEEDASRGEGRTPADSEHGGRRQGGHAEQWASERQEPSCNGKVDWRQYEPAIRRWERITGRQAPNPTEVGPKGNVRLSAHFVEWMMGLPGGWVTDVLTTRKDLFRTLGDGVLPQQAALAIGGLIDELSP